jgi:5'-nucleotidase
MRILITNDDSHRSPLLELAVEYFSKLGEVSLVVPLYEQSWKGKSMSRFEPLHVQKGTLCGLPALSVSGTPADCVNLAIYNLLPEKPDLVVSGINAGFNVGLGFILSSGTVGACLEANLAGVPALALSQAFDPETRSRYSLDYMIESRSLERFRNQTTSILDHFLSKVSKCSLNDTFLRTPVTWNINFPSIAHDLNALKVTPIAQSRYTRVFNETSSKEGDPVRTFSHSSINEIKDPSSDCDTSLIVNGCATLSLIDIWGLGALARRAEVNELLDSFQ